MKRLLPLAVIVAAGSASAVIESEPYRALGPVAPAQTGFGESVALDGDIVAVGVPYDDQSRTNEGSVYLFHRNAGGTNAWEQAKRIVRANAGSIDFFGWSVAVDGNYLAAGARYGDSGSRSNIGTVSIFARNAGGTNRWNQITELAPLALRTGDQFGVSVALDGDVLVAGAPDHDLGITNRAGTAFVFERRSSGATNTWDLIVQLFATDTGPAQVFGSAVDVDGDVMAVGAPGANGGTGGEGAVYLFQRGIETALTWQAIAKIQPVGLPGQARFGSSVSLKNGTLLVGAPGPTNISGSAYLFYRTRGGTNAWQEIARLEPSDAAAGQDFGRSVELAGDLALICAAASNAVYAFQRDAGGDDHWGEMARLTAPSGLLSSAEYAHAVAADAGLIVVGAPGQEAAYLHVFTQEEWTRTGTRSHNNRAADDEFGFSLDLDGATLIVGAPRREVSGTNDAGAAYIFERGTGDQIQRLEPFLSKDNIQFGFSVALDGDVAVVGSPNAGSISTPLAGSVDVFHRNAGGTNQWGWIHSLLSFFDGTNDQLGFSVDLSGDTIIAGRPNESGGRGLVEFHVRNHDRDNMWEYAGYYRGSQVVPGDYFGSAVAIDGDTAIVGAPGLMTNAGSAYIVQRRFDGSDDWSEVRRITPPAPEFNDSFGRTVALAGDTAMVYQYGTRMTYVYERDCGGSNRWGLAASLMPTNTAGVVFGFVRSLHLNGDIALLGDSAATVDGVSQAGAIWVFERHAGGSNVWGQVAVLRQTDPQDRDYMGTAVAISGQTIACGIPGDDPAGVTNAGRVAVFSGFLSGPPRIPAFSQTGSAFRIQFPAQPAWRYSVQGSFDLLGTTWLPIPGLSRLPGETDGTVDVGHTNLFNGGTYRIVREAP